MDDALDKKRVLVIEDEALLALDLEATLCLNGYAVAGPTASVAAALERIADAPPDSALVDLNLNGESGVPIADALADRGIPFVFLSGYDREHLPARHHAVPMLRKPYHDRLLLSTLAHVMRKTG